MNIYFSGSIRGGREDAERYQRIIIALQQYGTVLTEHIGDGTLTQLGSGGSPEDIYKKDMSFLRQSDVVVADVTTPSLGVGYELAVAEQMKLSTLCLYREQDGKRLSAMILGNKYFQTRTYTSDADIASHLQTFFQSL